MNTENKYIRKDYSLVVDAFPIEEFVRYKDVFDVRDEGEFYFFKYKNCHYRIQKNNYIIFYNDSDIIHYLRKDCFLDRFNSLQDLIRGPQKKKREWIIIERRGNEFYAFCEYGEIFPRYRESRINDSYELGIADLDKECNLKLCSEKTEWFIEVPIA